MELHDHLIKNNFIELEDGYKHKSEFKKRELKKILDNRE